MTKQETVQAAIDVIKSAIEVYEAQFFICENCGRLAFMVDPGDGLISHAVIDEDGELQFKEDS